MDLSVFALLIALGTLARYWSLPKQLAELQAELARRQAEQAKLYAELHRLRDQVATMHTPGAGGAVPVAGAPAPPAVPASAAAVPAAPPRVAPAPVLPPVVRPPAPVAQPVPGPLPVPPRPIPAPVPAGPTWWERAAAVLLENWTGILGAVVLVTGVGFLGIYAALRLAPPFRFLLVCGFAGGLLGARFALRAKAFAQQLNAWLLSSAAAIFLFACVGAASIDGLRWATPPFDYLLLLLGVSANLYLAWRASREAVATLHGVLSLVALAVLPPTALTLGAAAGVTAFGIAITYRQRWRYQLLLSIAGFFAFHLYWHRQLPSLSDGLRLAAMGLVLLVGAAAAVVQYRRVYARRQFEALLFAAHVLNWTCLGVNLYLYSTGSVWKTIPLALGALLTFGAGRRAKRLGIGWLFQTDTILSLLLALATALSLQGWHATGPVILLFMLLESLLIALIMARQGEALVYRVALAGALLAGGGLLLVAAGQALANGPGALGRDALVLALAGGAGLAFALLTYRQPLLRAPAEVPAGPGVLALAPAVWHRDLLGSFVGLAGALQAGAGLLLLRAAFIVPGTPVAQLGALLALAGGALGLAAWVRAAGLVPDWVRQQQLVLAQFLAVLAGLGLHEMGLSWPAVVLVLYAEGLLVAGQLHGRPADDGLLHAQTYLLVLYALLLPLLLRYTSLGALGPLGRAGLGLAAAWLTLAYQVRRQWWPRTASAPECAVWPLGAAARVPALGLAVGWLLLGAGELVFARPWAGWAAAGLLGALLYLRGRVAAPGLWAGLALAGTGYLGLQWGHALLPARALGAGPALLYLLPTLAVPLVSLRAAWWPAGGQFVRWPGLYVLGLHLLVALGAAVPAGHAAYYALGLLALAGAAFAGALAWRRALPDAAAVARAGQPDRYLLHLGYGLLAGSLLAHAWLLARAETFVGQPAEYFTAALLFGGLGALAAARPPASAPVYRSWRVLHPGLPEAALLFGTATLAHHVRTPWLPLLWAAAALALTQAAAGLPARFRRLGLYGRLYYWLAAATAGAACLRYLAPGQLLRPDWWAITAAVGLLFGYVGLGLRVGNAPFADLPSAWAPLARPTRRQLEAWLLYPAFGALALLLIQSFDRSVLTVLLMLEVVAVFSTSLLLRRQDLRYGALAGMLGCLVRLVFFDLSQSGTVTRAVVFIFMGLLLLGMNALYARFKARFAGPIGLEDGESGPDEPGSESPD